MVLQFGKPQLSHMTMHSQFLAHYYCCCRRCRHCSYLFIYLFIENSAVMISYFGIISHPLNLGLMPNKATWDLQLTQQWCYSSRHVLFSDSW